MKGLITPAAVVASAFADGEYVAQTAVTDHDVVVAELRYLRPVIGEALHLKLLAGEYADFTREYVAPVVALYTRIVMQPRLNVRAGQSGVSATESATDAQAKALAESLLAKARTLLLRLSDYLEQNASSFAEYNTHTNILKRCRIDGHFVQIL